MNDLYQTYKPLRNHLRQVNLSDGLVLIWQLSNHVAGQRNLSQPSNRPEDNVYGWELPTIAREVILNGLPTGVKKLNIATVVNGIRKMGSECASLRFEDGDDVMIELSRIAHQQFPWQQGSSSQAIIRYLVLFDDPTLAAILERRTGLSRRDYFFLGLALCGHLASRWDINALQDYRQFGIGIEKCQNFFKKISLPVEDLKTQFKTFESFDAAWDYSMNPLERFPLVSLDKKHPERLYCPVPDLLLRRFSHALHNDCYGSDDFKDAYGKAFERYVGEFLRRVLPSNYVVHQPEPYIVKKVRHLGVDWIVSNEQVNIFIECKTNRIPHRAKFSLESDSIFELASTLSSAVVQNYRNINEALAGKSKWSPNGLPSICLVVTLEDWMLFSPLVINELRNRVFAGLEKEGIRREVVDEIPYAIMSARELENSLAAIINLGPISYICGKNTPEFRDWMWDGYTNVAGKGIPRLKIAEVFSEAFDLVLNQSHGSPPGGG